MFRWEADNSVDAGVRDLSRADWYSNTVHTWALLLRHTLRYVTSERSNVHKTKGSPDPILWLIRLFISGSKAKAKAVEMQARGK
jgi:hypothetical protein